MPGDRRLLRPASSRRRRLGGAIYAEAVLVMGTMILLLFLLEFVHDGFDRAAVSGTGTRGAGWAHVMEPCENDPPAPTDIRDVRSFDIGSVAGMVVLGARGLQLAGRFQPALLADIRLFDIRIPRSRYSQVDDLERPGALGDTARFGHQIVLSCDEDLDSMEFGMLKMGGYVAAAWYRAGL